MPNYYISFDENGTPYIEHGWLSDKAKEWKDKGAKYIEKIQNGNSTRYFYSQEELQAYYDKLRNKAKNATEKAKQSVNSAVNKAKDYGNKALQSAQTAANNAKQSVNSAVDKAKDYGNQALQKAKDKAKDIAGYDERERYNSATQNRKRVSEENKKLNDAYDKARDQYLESENYKYWGADKKKSSPGNPDKLFEKYLDAREKAYASDDEKRKAQVDERKAYLDYLKTPLGSIDAFSENVKDTANKVKKSTKELIDNTKDKIDEKSGKYFKQQILNNSIRAGVQALESKKAYKELEELRKNGITDSQGRIWYDNFDDANKDYDLFQEYERKKYKSLDSKDSVKYYKKLYADTPLGKLEALSKDAKATIDKAKQSVNSTIEAVKEYGSEKMTNINKWLNDVKTSSIKFDNKSKENKIHSFTSGDTTNLYKEGSKSPELSAKSGGNTIKDVTRVEYKNGKAYYYTENSNKPLAVFESGTTNSEIQKYLEDKIKNGEIMVVGKNK